MKERKIKHLISIFIFGLFTLMAIASLDNSSSNTTKSNLNVSVENVRIDKSISNAWGVIGQIRNNTSMPIKGAVKIKFINSKGDIVYSGRAFVNDGDYFKPGQAANFKYFVEPEKFNDVVDFKIIFYEK